MPALFAEEYVSNYSSQPDPNLGGRSPNLWQGRAFGGGSAVNAMAYCRGASSKFDQWAELSGNDGLAWDSLLDDFRATAHYKFQPANYTEIVNTSGYGDGPLEVSRQSGQTGFDIPFANALQSELDLQQVDMTDGTGIGVELGLETIRVANRTRSYALNAFGYQMADRPNVQLIHDAMVQRINFLHKTARGVTYINTLNNQTHTVNAKEVIVSAGAINSPRLLMLSGVGPKATLSRLSIPVVLDVPNIGSNLYDHHYSTIEVQVISDIITTWQWGKNATEEALATAEYAANSSGPLGWDDGATYGCARLPNSIFEEGNDSYYPSIPQDRPQVMYQFQAAPMIQPPPNVSIVSTWSTLLQPEATGYLTINTSDYRDPPVIYSNYFGSPSDKMAIMYAYKKLRSILQSDYVKPLIVQEIFPGANVTTDAEIWQAIQHSAGSFHHPVGTVALGTVLDRNWRIKGLKGIRVVDSSTLPTPPTCHPQGSVYAIAHRAARDIAQADHK